MKIVIKCRPMQLYHRVFIWKKDSIETHNVLAADIPKFVLSHSDVDEVILAGNQKYVEHYKNDIQKQEQLKFGTNKIKITIEGK